MKKILVLISFVLLGACTTGEEFVLFDDEAVQPTQQIESQAFDTKPQAQTQQAQTTNDTLREDNMYMIDKTYKYESFAENKTFSDDEKRALAEKWKDTNITTKYHHYHGNVIKVDTQRSARDLREMRLRFYYGENDGFNDGDINHVLSQVSRNIIKETCGRGAMDALIVYDRPSADFKKPTAFYDYQMMESGVAVREVSYRCMYPNGSMNGNFDCDK